jgi:uroporphyrinogen decarboxylase
MLERRKPVNRGGVTMNKVERVRAALAGRDVDHVPASFWYHFPAEQAHGVASVEAHLAYYRASDIDFLKVMNEHPYRTDVIIQQPSDWRKLRPAPLSSAFYQEQLDEIKRIVDGIGGKCLVITTIFGPFSSGNHASDGRVTEDLKADPESVSAGLSTIAESLASFALACIDAGAAGIYYSAQGGEEGRFTEEQFARYLKPHDLTVLQALEGHGEFNLLHVCGDHICLPLYADYPSHAVNWAATKRNLGLKQGRDLFKRTVVGGLGDRGLIVEGPADAIQAAVRKVIADVGPRGLMIGADCTVPTDIDINNIRAAVQATHEAAVS